jgi:hypothetical protein
LPGAAGVSSCADDLRAKVVSTSTEYVDADNARIYRYVPVGGLDYAQAKAACQALTYTGFTGTGYPVVWNMWVIAAAAAAATAAAATAAAAAAIIL